MTTTSAQLSWTEANQLHLRAELGRLERRFGDTGAAEGEEASPPPAINPPPAIDQLTELFGLSAFERDIVLLAAGIEMYSALAAACPRLTFGVALSVLADPHWDALSPSRPLRHFNLVRLEVSRGLIDGDLLIDERILHYLAGLNDPDPRLAFVIRPAPSPGSIAEEHQAIASRAAELIVAARTGVPVVQLCGDDQHGQEDVAALIAASVGRALFAAEADDVPPAGPDLEGVRSLWEREALLLPAALLIRCGADGLTQRFVRS